MGGPARWWKLGLLAGMVAGEEEGGAFVAKRDYQTTFKA